MATKLTTELKTYRWKQEQATTESMVLDGCCLVLSAEKKSGIRQVLLQKTILLVATSAVHAGLLMEEMLNV